MTRAFFRQIRLKIDDLTGTHTLGPGMADLLELIGQTGSISGAARGMGMSYRRAWALVQAVNATFRKPLVECKTGGARGGGAALTKEGVAVLKAYRDAEQAALKAVRPYVRRIRARMRSR